MKLAQGIDQINKGAMGNLVKQYKSYSFVFFNLKGLNKINNVLEYYIWTFAVRPQQKTLNQLTWSLVVVQAASDSSTRKYL